MTSFRITQNSVAQRTLTGLQGNMSRLAALQEQLSSGRSISRPSDSPTGAVSAMQLRSELRATEQYARNATDGLGWLGTLDTTLTGSLSAVRKVRDLTLWGMNGGGASPASREAMATEVLALRDSLIGLANTTYLGRPVFGGTTAGTTAYDPATGAYVGDGRPLHRAVGAQASVRVDVTGPEAFGTGDANLFIVLADIATKLRTDPAALGGDLNRLDAAMGTIQNKLADVGARFGRTDQMRQAADDRLITLRSSLSEVEDIDLPATIVDLQMQEIAYQAALGATQRVLTPSLSDFLR